MQCIERTPSILCLECFPGHKPILTANEIGSCVPECNSPLTVLKDILPKGQISPCQMTMWSNTQMDHISTNFFGSNQNPTSAKELNALKALYTSLNGNIWGDNSHWNDGDPCIHKWHGIECNVSGQIIGISFNQNGLHGVIPNIIIDLIYLRYIHITNTIFESTLPSANNIFKVSPNVFLLPDINDIMIMNVNLKQDLSSIINIGSYTSTTIEIIDLSFNRLFGAMPSFAAFTNLRIINLSFNDLSGNLAMLNTLSSSVYDISLQNNLFTGNIPNLNNVMNSLEYFDIRNTTVTGAIPSNLISDNFFIQLKYIGLMMTNVTMPNECKNTPFCIKKIMKNRRSIYDNGFDLIAEDLKYLQPRS